MIAPPGFSKIAPYNRLKTNAPQYNSSVSFGARHISSNPLYEQREDKFIEIKKSAWYRVEGEEKFKQTIKAIESVFKAKAKPRILLAGVANLEEPFSYLTVIKDILRGDSARKNKYLDEVVDLCCIDAQAPISQDRIEKLSYLRGYDSPPYAKSSFVKEGSRYRVSQEILEFLSEVLGDPSSTHWNTFLENFSQDCARSKAPKDRFDLISCKNVLCYMNDRMKRCTAEHLCDMLNPGGIIITDEHQSHLIPAGFKRLGAGIFQKLK